ncbi:hypothetical protein J4475_02940 [Candidatus Woesearchaeota archaeon]|nr:hypothetical protein [Candidatus Woesearchaeota archaeon]
MTKKRAARATTIARKVVRKAKSASDEVRAHKKLAAGAFGLGAALGTILTFGLLRRKK